MEFPSNVKYTKEHEWIRVEGDIAYVGITDYAQEQLGDIVFVDITTEGETLEKDEVFGTIEVVKTISDLFLPVSGEVLEQNEALADNPELVNQDPYGKGWLIKIKPNDTNDVNDLLDAEGYKALVNEYYKFPLGNCSGADYADLTDFSIRVHPYNPCLK